MPNKNREKTKSAPRLSSDKIRLLAMAVIPVLIVAAALLLGGSSDKPAPARACGNYRSDRVIHINGRAFSTEVASSADEFSKGLGGRPCILSSQAMLFAFKQPGQYPFWMKDMKFPIDMIWVGADDKVAGYYTDVKPSSYPNSFENDQSHPAQYVIEVKSGTAKKLGLAIGSPVSF